MTTTPRLRRLFNARSGRCIDVAVDHGLFGEARFLTGIEDMASVVDTLVAAAPDAIQLSVGEARLLVRHPEPRPALVLRTDVANVYGPTPPAKPFSVVIDDAVGHALRLDSACVCVNLFDIPGADDLRRQCIENISRLRTECDRAEIGLMVEPLVFKPGASGYDADGDPARIAALARQPAELGADVIKADPTDDPADFAEIVKVAGVPVLVRGGSRVSDADLLVRTAAVLEQGAAGVVYGRNVIQHERPAAMVRALRAVVHDRVSAQSAAAELAA